MIEDVFRVEWVTEFVLLSLVAVTAVAVVLVRNLFAATMLAGVYSLLMALVWVNMYAMDVAFTEAAVGAGISTLLLLGALVFTGTEEKRRTRPQWKSLLPVIVTGVALAYGTLDMPAYGDPDAPVHKHVSPEYREQRVGKDSLPVEGGQTYSDFGDHVPNAVTAVLADYRSFDTMFETAVIFTAGICLVLLLRQNLDPPGPASPSGSGSNPAAPAAPGSATAGREDEQAAKQDRTQGDV